MNGRCRGIALVLLTALANLLGCTTDECPALEACDIRRPSCQRQIAQVTACLRGGDAAAPEVEVVDADTFIQNDVDTSVMESEDARDLRRTLALFGLAPTEYEREQQVRDYWDTVAAFYSSSTDKVTVLDRGVALDSSRMATLLVHEFVHAMQDTELDDTYFATHGNTFDSNLAFSAIREGEAVLYQDLASVQGFGIEADEVRWDGVFRRFQDNARAALRADEAKYQLAGRRFPYAFGGGYVNTAWRSGGNQAVHAIYDELPTSTRQIMAGYSATQHSSPDPTNDPSDVGVPIAIEGYERFATRRLGAWLFETLVTESTQLAGDVFSAWRNVTTGDVVGAWRMRFDTLTDADSFCAAMQLEAGVAVSQDDDRDVMIVASTDRELAETIIDQIEWENAPETDWAEVIAEANSRDDRHLCTMHAAPR